MQIVLKLFISLPWKQLKESMYDCVVKQNLDLSFIKVIERTIQPGHTESDSTQTMKIKQAGGVMLWRSSGNLSLSVCLSLYLLLSPSSLVLTWLHLNVSLNTAPFPWSSHFSSVSVWSYRWQVTGTELDFSSLWMGRLCLHLWLLLFQTVNGIFALVCDDDTLCFCFMK